MIKIFKFGGTSIKDVSSIKKVVKILDSYKNEKLLIIFSAMGKVTNMLEDVVESYFFSHNDLRNKLDLVKEYHFDLLDDLFKKSHKIYDEINNLFLDIINTIAIEANKNYSYHYDQIVSVGEILSTKIICAYLNDNGFSNNWIDARYIIKTDNTYRNAKIDWEQTISCVNERIIDFPIITQGFIGSNSENHTTTLGREGSDFTAAILAFVLKAKEVVIWKDVYGILNADPRFFDKTTLFNKVPFHEAIELAFFGAKVIHPKTIQPLQKANIPLKVKSFLNPRKKGTIIKDVEKLDPMTPAFIVKENQILISISDKNLSFIVEKHLSKIFAILSFLDINVNLMQNSAVSFSICVDNDPQKVPQFITKLKDDFELYFNDNLELFTIRHYNVESKQKILGNKTLYLEQKSRNTLQLVLSK